MWQTIKSLWNKPSPSSMENVVMVSPSVRYSSNLRPLLGDMEALKETLQKRDFANLKVGVCAQNDAELSILVDLLRQMGANILFQNIVRDADRDFGVISQNLEVDIIILAIFNPTVYRLRYLFTKLLASEHSIEVIAPSYPYDPLNEDETFNLIVNNLLAKTDFDKSFFNTYANYGAYQLLRMALRYPGDCMEFGCYYGQSASFLAETMEVLKIDRNKRIFLFDTWEGMPSSNKAADGYYKKGDFSDTSLEKIQKTLAPWSYRFEYVKGDIVKTLPAVKPCQLCYARIDVDLYEPAKVALNTIYDWIIPGGIVYLDDYISVYTVGERIAIDEVLENYVEKPFYNVGDRAYIIKGVV